MLIAICRHRRHRTGPTFGNAVRKLKVGEPTALLDHLLLLCSWPRGIVAYDQVRWLGCTRGSTATRWLNLAALPLLGCRLLPRACPRCTPTRCQVAQRPSSLRLPARFSHYPSVPGCRRSPVLYMDIHGTGGQASSFVRFRPLLLCLRFT